MGDIQCPFLKNFLECVKFIVKIEEENRYLLSPYTLLKDLTFTFRFFYCISPYNMRKETNCIFLHRITNFPSTVLLITCNDTSVIQVPI